MIEEVADHPVCPECGLGRLVPLTRAEEFGFDLGDRTIRVRAEAVPVQQCDRCGTILSGPEAARIRHDAVCRAAGLFTPAEIRSIRERTGLTQEELAALVGVDAALLGKWERGRALQDRSHDHLLALLAEREENRTLLRRRLSARSA